MSTAPQSLVTLIHCHHDCHSLWPSVYRDEHPCCLQRPCCPICLLACILHNALIVPALLNFNTCTQQSYNSSVINDIKLSNISNA